MNALLTALLALLLLVPGAEVLAAKKKTKKTGSVPKAGVTVPRDADFQGPRMPVYQGPPAPPVLRAAGVCMQYEPGIFIVLAEVGGSGRVFRLDSNTNLEVKPNRGGRLRILYLDSADGPLARKVMQGPIEAPSPAVPSTSGS
jgi:hypothetical protein